MNDLTQTITEQLQQLQMLMHRMFFHGSNPDSRRYSPLRGQGRVLAILKMKPEISQRELTYLLGMSKQSLSELLSKLEKNGFITRELSVEDKRVITIKLTEEGLAASADSSDRDDPDLDNLLDCLGSDELQQFSDYLARIISRYEEKFPNAGFTNRRKFMEQFRTMFGSGYEARTPHDHRGHPHEEEGRCSYRRSSGEPRRRPNYDHDHQHHERNW